MPVTIDSSSTYAVDYSTADVVNAWRTARLEFIKIDKSDQNIKEFLPQTEQDPVVLSLASSQVLAPAGQSDLDERFDALSKSLLGVAICLGPSEREDQQPPSEKDKKGKEKPTIIGTMCLGWGGISPQNAHHRSAHMGIVIGKAYQNKGYGREAINWMVDWAFKHAGLHTVCMVAVSYNQRGIHLYQDIGFRLEGRRREVCYFNRAWHDELDFGMTEHEWEKLRGASS
ncbi:acetyltransferase (GNAT) domain protein [Metarhizium robertsii]|uniref:GCN5-related N-acetyltransferase (GNAT) domain protein n=2 Tax=Metarhizium robertsii TaxID=568076 RepID=E9F2E7_METRA|nr:GCN5-related N-acetyltransferase (GNAT) domain protein [Metarhizium robertsii ARSEF 23]EFY98236.1 GCN5-related N-acetyltransferase (GNAT) domain protein [Metarhizium robertsii ARSEF 23]EXV01618.1 acetyltransferase (GNAT) domain protein [Metarhizium robertsii]